jgi:hypothetical protein
MVASHLSQLAHWAAHHADDRAIMQMARSLGKHRPLWNKDPNRHGELAKHDSKPNKCQ